MCLGRHLAEALSDRAKNIHDTGFALSASLFGLWAALLDLRGKTLGEFATKTSGVGLFEFSQAGTRFRRETGSLQDHEGALDMVILQVDGHGSFPFEGVAGDPIPSERIRLVECSFIAETVCQGDESSEPVTVWLRDFDLFEMKFPRQLVNEGYRIMPVNVIVLTTLISTVSLEAGVSMEALR